MSTLYVDIDDTLVTWLSDEGGPHPYGHAAKDWRVNAAVLKKAEEWPGKLVIWSGGGLDYAVMWANRLLPHLAWTAARLRELDSRPSLLNPFWYAGAFVMGAIAARAGDAHSLGFVVETERQVEAHLNSHLERLPVQDERSRAIVTRMRDDEIAHADAARGLGAAELPAPVKGLMTAMAKVMTSTAYHL